MQNDIVHEGDCVLVHRDTTAHTHSGRLAKSWVQYVLLHFPSFSFNFYHVKQCAAVMHVHQITFHIALLHLIHF